MNNSLQLLDRNVMIRNHRLLWQWCSRSLHPRWVRAVKDRHHCMVGIAHGVDLGRSLVTARKCCFDIPEVYGAMAAPLFDQDGVLNFCDEHPQHILELALGFYTKGPCLAQALEQLRVAHGHNRALDSLTKKMAGREIQFGSEWLSEGFHPETEVEAFLEALEPLCFDFESLMVENYLLIGTLALEVLRQGPWAPIKIPRTMLIRKTPVGLLNKMQRFILWRAARPVMFEPPKNDRHVIKVYEALFAAVIPSMRSMAESHGYEMDHVIDDMVRFDIHKSRGELLA